MLGASVEVDDTSAQDPAYRSARPPPTSLTCISAREILRALRGEMALQQACGLADLDQVPVRVAHVAADLCSAVDRRRDKLCPLRLPVPVAGLDVSDPQVHEDRGGVARLVIDHRDARLVGG